MSRRRARMAVASVLLATWACVATPAVGLARCAMCARNAAAAGEAVGGLGSLLVAALVLLVPSLLIFAGLSAMLWKSR